MSSIISQTADSWPLPPSISSRSGHSPLCAVRVFLLQPGEAPLQHLAHHPEIVARLGLRPLDVELAVAVLAEALRPGDDHRAGRVGAHDVAVVVDLDPLRHVRQLEHVGKLAQDLAPACVVSASRRSSASSALRAACSISLRRSPRCGRSIATLRPARSHSASSSSSRVGQVAIEQDPARRRHLLVELHQEARQHLLFGHVGWCARGRRRDGPNSGRRG